MKNMIANGMEEYVEVGPGKVLQGLLKKVDRKISTSSASI
jgi:[acyl-carrier-protein] S-malonyltransferase